MLIIESQTGAQRHAMSRAELDRLYREIEKFVADSTLNEWKANEQSIKNVLTMIHQRMRTADVPGVEMV